MIKLHGMPLSNYYNVVKCVMLEKEVPFEEVAVKPNQESDYLLKSPMGKVPCMETAAGFLTETSVSIYRLLSSTIKSIGKFFVEAQPRAPKT